MLSKEKLEFLKSFNKLAFAISGGKDSMALLHYAINHLEKDSFFVITVHHNLRGKEGERDRDFVVDYCAKNKIECVVYEEQIKEFCQENGYTIEQGARIVRRNIFTELIEDKKADRVVTAHHKDDQIESILMHIFRGSGIKGLCGMELDTGVIIRPMLDVSSSEIAEYIAKNNIEYVQDSTNFELDYSRNKIRNVVTKDIESVYPNFGDNLLRLSDIATSIETYISSQVQKPERIQGGVAIKIADLKNKDIIASQAIINAVDAISTRVDLEKRHIDLVFSLLNKDNGKEVKLPYGVSAIREYDRIIFTKSEDEDFDEVKFDFGVFELGSWQVEVSKENNGGLKLDFDKAKNSVFRTRRNGDEFKRYKGGTKSLGDYLTDIKVARRLRDYLPIIAKDSKVLAVLPYEIADSVAIDEKTTTIAFIKAQHIE